MYFCFLQEQILSITIKVIQIHASHKHLNFTKNTNRLEIIQVIKNTQLYNKITIHCRSKIFENTVYGTAHKI